MHCNNELKRACPIIQSPIRPQLSMSWASKRWLSSRGVPVGFQTQYASGPITGDYLVTIWVDEPHQCQGRSRGTHEISLKSINLGAPSGQHQVESILLLLWMARLGTSRWIMDKGKSGRTSHGGTLSSVAGSCCCERFLDACAWGFSRAVW